MRTHSFYANDNFYELRETNDIFGCTCVTITENDVYRGCVDTADARDFLRIEHRIVIEPDYVDTCEVYS
ncbi:hypothetical protein AYP1020_p41 (plasmid) [Staphylococcus capitis subsp. capitis]|uniref:hypothetical protein n=1 Tax=Staphylococcus capitis TaxID=29388 RepID=UPI00064A87FD|nr:hypothetical protein [Staphylococcus capitis]AKL93496.1 hypothetical protein AYP1020_p41 [Staphylococcus capitis subsp. capitis]